MPITPTYPGVYIEEIPSGVRAITGVSTSVAAFLGYFKMGLVNKAVQIFNMGDFEREFGGLHSNSEASYAIQQFFLNGGAEAWIVRTASGSVRKANVEILDGMGGATALTVEAISEGEWGKNLRVSIDYNTSDPASLFNMTVSEYVSNGGTPRVARSEVFRNLSMNSSHYRFVDTVLNDETSGSKLIRVTASGTNLPLQNGTVSGDLSTFPTLTATSPAVNVTIGTEGTFTANFREKPAELAKARSILEAAIRSSKPDSPAFASAKVEIIPNCLRILAGPTTATSRVTFSPAGADPTLTELMLDTGSVLSVEGVVSGDLSTFPTLTSPTPAVNVTIGSEGPHTATFASVPTSLATTRTQLEDAIRAAHTSPAFTGARVAAYDHGGESRLVVVAGTSGDTVLFTAAPTDTTTLNELKLDAASATANVQEYTLGAGAAIPNTAQGAGVAGNDGSPPDGTALIGDLNSKTGIYALEDVDLFNILCIPRTAIVSGPNALSNSEAAAVIAVANSYCEKRRAFFIIDTPNNIDEVQEIKDWLDANATLRHKNSGLYFPRVKFADPLNEFRLRSFGASGTIAGLYARIDGTRGVWKAPAGTEATLANVQALDYALTNEQNGTLNPQAINCLRNFAVYGNVCWGARTLDGADQMVSEWKYIPVRRLALFIEESLYRGTKWVVFEPNDEPLWSQIRLNVGAFMHRLFRQGAFQGSTPREAYFVKCDKETTTQNDINLGIVNILVGFAPLKPAEFVVIKIQQMAGQIQA